MTSRTNCRIRSARCRPSRTTPTSAWGRTTARRTFSNSSRWSSSHHPGLEHYRPRGYSGGLESEYRRGEERTAGDRADGFFHVSLGQSPGQRLDQPPSFITRPATAPTVRSISVRRRIRRRVMERRCADEPAAAEIVVEEGFQEERCIAPAARARGDAAQRRWGLEQLIGDPRRLAAVTGIGGQHRETPTLRQFRIVLTGS